MNETECVALIFILKENQSKNKRRKKTEEEKTAGLFRKMNETEWWKGEADRFAGYKRKKALIFGLKENDKENERENTK